MPRLHSMSQGAWRAGWRNRGVRVQAQLSRLVRRRRGLLVALLWLLVLQYAARRALDRAIDYHTDGVKAEHRRQQAAALAAALAAAQAHVTALEVAAAQPGGGGGAARAALARAYQGDGGGADPLSAAAQALMGGLRAHDGHVPCPADPTLPPGGGGNATRLFFAANLHDSERLMPHYITELTGALAMFPARDVYVSVYESGSNDGTVAWLGVLARVVAALGCPHRIVTVAGERRGEGQDRIDYLAGVRNKAMRPLYEAAESRDRRRGVERAGGGEGPPAPAEAGGGGASAVLSSAGAVPRVTKVVFLNDVHFCAEHVARLVAHGDTDLTCGMDFDRPELLGQERHVKEKFMADTIRGWVGGKRVAARLARWTWLRRKWSAQKHIEELWVNQSVPGFYDIWVAHDVGGHMFAKMSPYLQHAYSRNRLAKGLPFPVHCCWNGIAVINAEPFWEHGLQFRMHHDGECAASECSLMCADLARLGYGRAVVDPAVRLGYDPSTQRVLYSRVEGIPWVAWGDLRAEPAIDWGYVPDKTYVMCCPMPEGGTMVEFDDLADPWAVTGRKHCHQEDIFSPLPRETNSLAH